MVGERKSIDLECDKQKVEDYQSVETEKSMRNRHPEYDENTINDERIKQGAYSCLDDFKEAAICI